METKAHVFKSLAKIQQNDPQLLHDQWPVINALIWQLHFWLDEFFGAPDYETVYTLFYHREVRHHVEGISLAVEFFSQKFGQQYAELIRQEAEDHVCTDFGEIPSQAECSRHYLREKRGW